MRIAVVDDEKIICSEIAPNVNALIISKLLNFMIVLITKKLVVSRPTAFKIKHKKAKYSKARPDLVRL